MTNLYDIVKNSNISVGKMKSSDLFKIKSFKKNREVSTRLPKLNKLFADISKISANQLTITLVEYSDPENPYETIVEIVDGNGRLAIFNPENPFYNSKYGIKAPKEFNVIIHKVSSYKEAVKLYYSFDNEGAKESPTHRLSGYMKQENITFDNKRLKLGKDLLQMYGFSQGATSNTMNESINSILDNVLKDRILKDIEKTGIVPDKFSIAEKHLDYYLDATKKLESTETYNKLPIFNNVMSGYYSAFMFLYHKYMGNKSKIRLIDSVVYNIGQDVNNKETKNSSDPIDHLFNFKSCGLQSYALPKLHNLFQQGGVPNAYAFRVTLYYMDLYLNGEPIPQCPKTYFNMLQDILERNNIIDTLKNIVNK